MLAGRQDQGRWKNVQMCQGRSTPYIGDGNNPTFNDGILISWVYKPLRTWVDEFIPYYMEIMGVDRPWHRLEQSHSTNPVRLKLFRWNIWDIFVAFFRMMETIETVPSSTFHFGGWGGYVEESSKLQDSRHSEQSSKKKQKKSTLPLKLNYMPLKIGTLGDEFLSFWGVETAYFQGGYVEGPGTTGPFPSGPSAPTVELDSLGPES